MFICFIYYFNFYFAAYFNLLCYFLPPPLLNIETPFSGVDTVCTGVDIAI